MLNLPDVIGNNRMHRKYLIVGAGGGFDILGGVPLLRNLPAVMASYNTSGCKTFEKDSQAYPENRFSIWLKEYFPGTDLWSFPKVGVKPLVGMYDSLIGTYGIDTLILLDGGVDSLMHGDEEGAVTLLEDSVSLTAASLCSARTKVLCCLGFGTELEEGVCHYSVLENMARLSKNGGFLGACALTSAMNEAHDYKSACEFVWESGRKSHIQTKVISAIAGEFGDTNLFEDVDARVLGSESPQNFISPLMSLYWFYDVQAVVKENKLARLLANTQTSTDVLMVYRQSIDMLNETKRRRQWIPY